jgi:hypothetical protein
MLNITLLNGRRFNVKTGSLTWPIQHSAMIVMWEVAVGDVSLDTLNVCMLLWCSTVVLKRKIKCQNYFS